MSAITITITKTKPLFRRSQYRWTATHSNGNKMANGGEGYNNLEDLVKALHTLFGPRFSGHSLVGRNDDGTVTPL